MKDDDLSVLGQLRAPITLGQAETNIDRILPSARSATVLHTHTHTHTQTHTHTHHLHRIQVHFVRCFYLLFSFSFFSNVLLFEC